MTVEDNSNNEKEVLVISIKAENINLKKNMIS